VGAPRHQFGHKKSGQKRPPVLDSLRSQDRLKQGESPSALDYDPSAAGGDAQTEKELEALSEPEAALVTIGAAVCIQISVLGEKADKLRISQTGCLDTAVVHATHSDRRTVEPAFNYAQHDVGIDVTAEI